MNFPLNRVSDAEEFERFRREDRRAYLKSVAILIGAGLCLGLAIAMALLVFGW